MDCPQCGESGAYTGLQWVHCQNTECRYYDARYTAKVKQERESKSVYDSLDSLILLRGEVLDPDGD